MKSVVLALFLAAFLIHKTAYGSGWRCLEKDSDTEWGVRLYNHTDPSHGTSNPSLLVITESGATILLVNGEDIDVTTTSRRTDYKVKGGKKFENCDVTFRIGFVEGAESIPAGSRRVGKLLIDCEDGVGFEHKLVCKRYLKH